jgi:cellulose synthase operon protein YhjQ
VITVALQGIRGGVGTTSIVAGLALAAWRQGARVLAVDLCPDNQLPLHFGRPHDEVCGWGLLADPAHSWRTAIHCWRPGLDLLAQGGVAGPLSVDWLSVVEGYDLVLLDLPAGVTPVAATRLLTVVNADANAHTRLYRHLFVPHEQVVVTQFTSRRALQQDLLDLWMEAGIPMLSIRLHRDESMAEAMAAKLPVGEYAPDSLIAHELDALARWCISHSSASSC